ncbi:MAG: transcriptional regulator [Gammaproteobacteria bacterium]|nr:transcriptional regulator [Gammaproteobacteria bacterium]|tara:strand:+ start:246 stop:557 length:312 start_codon:yes stop_codon:yes gene_type:complete
MPIYEYKCSDCGHLMDALQGVNDSPLTDCPACSGTNLKRLISAPNFRLSGDGWYETDFKTENRKNIADSGKTEKKKKESSKESGDSKTDKKKDKKKDNSSKKD